VKLLIILFKNLYLFFVWSNIHIVVSFISLNFSVFLKFAKTLFPRKIKRGWMGKKHFQDFPENVLIRESKQ